MWEYNKVWALEPYSEVVEILSMQLCADEESDSDFQLPQNTWIQNYCWRAQPLAFFFTLD
jgi:hypothetical protein